MKEFCYYIVLLSFICFFSCKKKGCTDPIAENYNNSAEVDDGTCTYNNSPSEDPIVQINTNHLFNTESFSFDSIYQDDFGNNIQFSRALFYFGNPKFKSSTNSSVDSSRNYTLINPLENTYFFDTISQGSYNELDITIGVDSYTNHLDPASYPSSNDLSYQSPSMHWQMGSSSQNWSYLFIVLEGLVDKDGNNSFDPGETFVFHIGNDGLTNELNFASINLIANSGEIANLNLNVDWSSFFTGIDLSTDNFTHTNDNPALASAISSNGINVVSIQ